MHNQSIDGLRQGIELFNAGEFFDCHEVLEEFWRLMAPSPEKEVVQAIIQLAVAYYHAERANYTGALKLAGRACQRIEQSLNATMPFDVGALSRDANRALASLQEQSSPARFSIVLDSKST